MSMALLQGNFNALYFVLAIVGLTLLHASVNTLNDYSDFKTGIDLKVNRTPFSGGSGFLPANLLTPRAVLAIGLGTLLLAVPIGIYFLIVRGFHLLPLFIVGAIFILFYTSHLTRVGSGMAEIAAGLGLATLPVLGTFIILNGQFTFQALFASIPSGFLVANLLLMNEFPDSEADKSNNRRTLPIILGHKGAAIVYSSLNILTYLWIIFGVIFHLMPAWTLIALLTLPLGIKAISGSLNFKSFPELIPAQAANVMTVLMTQLLLVSAMCLLMFLGKNLFI